MFAVTLRLVFVIDFIQCPDESAEAEDECVQIKFAVSIAVAGKGKVIFGTFAGLYPHCERLTAPYFKLTLIITPKSLKSRSQTKSVSVERKFYE